MKVTIACDGSKQSEKAIHLAGTLPLKKCEIDVVNVKLFDTMTFTDLAFLLSTFPCQLAALQMS